MKQHDLFENEDALFLRESEEFLSEMELQVEKLEEQERFFEENKAFNWAKEFPQICDKNGKFEGFDVVLGNPPYISSKEIQNKKIYRNYETAKKQFDLFSLFIERALQITKQNGYNSMIIPDSFLGRNSFTPIRKLLYKKTNLYHIIQLDKVFKEANVSSCIYFLQKNQKKSEIEFWKTTKAECIEKENSKIKFTNFLTDNVLNSYRIVFTNEKELEIVKKIFLHIPISEITTSWRGEEIGKQAEVLQNIKKHNYLRILSGANVQKYFIKGSFNYIKKDEIKKNIKKYQQQKIVIRQVGNNITSTIANDITLQSVYCMYSNEKKYSNKFILGILNSTFANFVYKKYIAEKQTFPRILLHNLRKITIPAETEVNKKLNKQIENKVDKILKLKEQDTNIDISKFEKQIDKLVYKLYNLTKAEIKIIENETT